MENSIRINNDNDVYRIEVNDNGEYIEFNLLDIDLPFKFVNCGEQLTKKQEEYYEITSKIREEYKDDIETRIKKEHEIDNRFCDDLRAIFDDLLGEGACKKIFGNINTVGMYNKLFEELYPHFEKMKLKHDKIQKEIYEKYMPKKNDVI